MAISSHLRDIKALESIELLGNKITSIVAKKILSAIKENKCLYFSWNNIQGRIEGGC